MTRSSRTDQGFNFDRRWMWRRFTACTGWFDPTLSTVLYARAPAHANVNAGGTGFRACVTAQFRTGQRLKLAAEKVGYFVIPSAARDLLFHQYREKRRFLGHTPPSKW